MSKVIPSPKLSPSDFAFLYEDCPRCFWLKGREGIRQPSVPMASIYHAIDKHQKAFFSDKMLNEIYDELPEAKIVSSNNNVRSTYIEYPDLEYQHHINGRIDSLIKLTDGTYGIIDFKTSDATKYHKLYSRQLHAYAYAMLNPMKGNPTLDNDISTLGLVIFDPCTEFKARKDGNAALVGKIAWQPLEYNMEKFMEFMQEVAELLSGEIPEPAEDCQYCNMYMNLRDKDLIYKPKKEDDQPCVETT